jgi:CHAT domain-containing protein
MKFLSCCFFLGVSVLAAGAAQPPKSGTGTSSPRQAIMRGEGGQAQTAFEAQALEAEKTGNWGKASDSYSRASHAARNSGQFQKAITYAEKALEMAEKVGNPSLQAGAIFQLTLGYRTIGQYDKARQWAETGREVTKKITRQGREVLMQAIFTRELGMDYARRGQLKQAIQELSQARDLLETNLAFLKGLPPARLRQIPEAIPNTLSQMIFVLHSLGNMQTQVGNEEEGLKAYEGGIRILKESGVKTEAEINLYYGLGRLYLGQKDFTRAQENLGKTLEMAEKINSASLIYRASSQMGDLLRDLKKPAEAIPHYKKAVATVEASRSLLESEEFRSSYFEDKRGTYSRLILALLQLKDPAEAFNYNERARSRAFLDILGSKVQLARGGTLLEHERALQARMSVLQAMIGGQEPDSPEAPQLRSELAQAQQAYNEFLVEVRKENKEQASLMNVEPLTLKGVQELLEPGVTVLEYFVVQQAVLLWVVEKDRLSFVNIPIARTDLVAKVTSLRETIYQVGEKDKFNGLSQELYRLLIEPALPHVRGKELLIVPHDVLHYLPFQALLSSQSKYLIQDFPVYYLSSASLMQFTKEKRRTSRADDKALVMGNPSLGDEAYDLRFAEREAREVARAYPQSAVYLKAEATKAKTISLSPNYQILHFAVHGELKEDDPLGSALLLAVDGKEDGKLKVSEIFSLNLKADAVVLSACETALGKISNGDEIIGLTRAFIYAGTPSVIATLWKVNDRASYELMSAFYSSRKTMKKAEALRQAQLTTMKEFPQPFYWAAYALTGEP